LRDRTGNRRFLCVTVLDIDRNYSKDIKPEQIWAQAVALYLQGETGELTKGEEKARDNNNERYQVTNPAQDWSFKYYKRDPAGIEFTTDIVQTLQHHNYRGSTRSIQMDISSTLRSLGFEKHQISLNNNRGMAFFGISKIETPSCPNCGENKGALFFKFKSEKYNGDKVWHCKACHDPNQNQESFWYPEQLEDF
jgi:predicted P-loop ATPase